MKTEHTPEPWGVTDSRFIRQVSSPRHVVARIVGSDEMEANARRIVACVNACAGIPSEELESFAVNGFARAIADLAELQKQRDELLEAAEAIEIDAEECLDFDECTAMLVPIDTYHKLMEAIASVKEK